MAPPPAPALLLIAHGSRDPRHAATVAGLAARVGRLRPGVRVATAYLNHCAPGTGQVIDCLAGTGAEEVAAVPLLLSRAFHATTDVPAVLRQATARHPRLRLHQAAVLGPSPLLLDALQRRLREAGVAPGHPATAVVLASAGSTDPTATAAIASLAGQWQRRAGWPTVVTSFASSRPPSAHPSPITTPITNCAPPIPMPRTQDAVAQLRRNGAERVAVARYVLAPGRLPDRIAAGAHAAGADAVTAVLGDAPEVAQLILHRYDDALGFSAGRAKQIAPAPARFYLASTVTSRQCNVVGPVVAAAGIGAGRS